MSENNTQLFKKHKTNGYMIFCNEYMIHEEEQKSHNILTRDRNEIILFMRQMMLTWKNMEPEKKEEYNQKAIKLNKQKTKNIKF